MRTETPKLHSSQSTEFIRKWGLRTELSSKADFVEKGGDTLEVVYKEKTEAQ